MRCLLCLRIEQDAFPSDYMAIEHLTYPLSSARDLSEINRESGDHQNERIGCASHGLIDASQGIAIVPPQ